MQNKKVVLLLLAIVLLPYVIISFYCHPAGDDFSYAASSMHKGYWFSYFRDYHIWNGRYTSNFLVFASPLVWNSFFIYKLIPLLLLVLSYFSLLFFIQTITNKKITEVELHLFASTVLVLYLYNAPSFTETFYWYTGAITYQLANVLTLVYLALLYRHCDGDYCFNRTIHTSLMLLLIPSICGFNEVIMLFMLAFHALFSFKWIRYKKENKGVAVLLLLIVASAASIMLFAPGNAGRASNFPEKYQLFHSIYMTALQTVRFMFKWIIQVPFIAATVLFVPVSKRLAEVSPFFKNNFYVSPLITFLCLPAILFLYVFPAYWNMGMLGQHRTLNAAYFFFIPLWFMNVHIAVNQLSAKVQQTIIPNAKYKVVFTLLLFAGSFLANNGYTVCVDLLSGGAISYDREMNERYTILRSAAAAGAKEVVVSNLNSKPAALHIFDITCEPGNWINKSSADYFGLEGVRLRTCD